MKNMMKAIGYLIYYVIFQILIISGIALILAISNNITSEIEINNFINNNALGLTIITNIVSILVLFIFFRIRKKKFLDEINFQKINLKNCILPALISFCYSMAFAMITHHMSFTNQEQISNSIAYYSSIVPNLGIILQIVALLIISPITEEIICRGLILTRIQRNFHNVIAILFSGLLFGIIHLVAGGITLSIGALIMGIIFGTIYVKTKSLVITIISHSIANIPDFIISLLPNLSKDTQCSLIIIFLLISILLFFIFIKNNTKELNTN